MADDLVGRRWAGGEGVRALGNPTGFAGKRLQQSITCGMPTDVAPNKLSATPSVRLESVMMRRVLIISIALTLLFPVPSVGQEVDDSREVLATATLPVSNEAMLLAGRVQQAVVEGDYRLAVVLLDELFKQADQLVVVPPGRTYYPVWWRAGRLVEQLPEEGLATYRGLHDAEVATLLKEASARGDIPALINLFRIFRGSANWPAIGRALLAHLLDAGRFGEVLEIGRDLEAAGISSDPRRCMQMVVALGQLEHWSAAGRRLDKLVRDPDTVGNPLLESRCAQLRSWLDRRMSTALVNAEYQPAMVARVSWRSTLEPPTPGFHDDDATCAEAIGRLRRLPLHTPLIAGETLIIRLRGTLWAYDTLTLTLRWVVSESEQAGSDELSTWAAAGSEAGVSADSEVLLSHVLRHGVSGGLGMVFTVEGLNAADWENTRSGGRFGEIGLPPAANELVARDLSSGQLVWRRGDDVTDPLYGVAFQDCPVVVGERLCAVVQRGSELHLCVLAAATGRLEREIPIVGPPTYFTPSGGRCTLTADATGVYVCTGNGVVAAFSRGDLSWRWATTYPSTLAERRSTGWWPPREEPREYNFNRPILSEDLCVLAPVDCPYIFALDRHNGRQCWRIPRDAYGYLIGACPVGIIIGGDVITCLDPRDGHTPRWRSVPLEISGRPVLHAERVYVPTRKGLVVLDTRTGKVRQEPPGTNTLMTANLVSTTDTLFAVSPNAVVKYPDLAQTRRRCAALLAAGENDERIQLAQAWVDVLEGAYGAALEGLEALDPADEKLAQGRECLLTDLFVVLSDESPDGVERLEWLRRAARLTVSGETSDRLATLIGQALEDAQEWEAAAQHYAELLADETATRLAEVGDSGRQVAVWLHAVNRLRTIFKHMHPEQVVVLLEDWVAEATPQFLQRMDLAVRMQPQRQLITRTLARAQLPPELLAGYSPVRPAPTEPLDEQWADILARWETHVALGMLAESWADQREWYDQQEADTGRATTQPGPMLSPEMTTRARRIETALSKLADAAGPAVDGSTWKLSERYRWKIWGAELVVDARNPEAAMRAWIPVRMLEDNQLTLHSTVLGRAWRQTVDALTHGLGGQVALREAASEISLGHEYGEGEYPRATWPAAVHGYLAAVPVRNGLVCIGLGPERGGGQRLWEVAIPEWSSIPTQLSDVTAAGPLGVHIIRHGDRVALIGWADGQVWWQRSFNGLRIRQILLADERLIVVGEGGQMISLDALLGDDVRTLPPILGTVRAVAWLGDTLVALGEQAVLGLAADTLERHWSRPYAGVADWATVTGADWLALQESDSDEWIVLDARTGTPVGPDRLGHFGHVTAMAVDRGDLLVAGFERVSDGDEEKPLARLASFDLASGELHWDRRIVTLARINTTQLLAHPTKIPILIARSDYEYADEGDYRALDLYTVNKQSGAQSDSFSIYRDFCDSDGVCLAYVLASPDALIVQANGILAAYGMPTVRLEP
ncbi:MAG: PQQ-binding-like beta-propeller repeat protein [Planctomycetota bacterium]